MNEAENKLLNDLKGNMTDIYNLNKICPWNPTTRKPDCRNGKTWALDPEMTDRLAESTDYDELKYNLDNYLKDLLTQTSTKSQNS